MTHWYPLATRLQHGRPDIGWLIAYQHAAWRVTNVEDAPLTESDRETWLDRGMPDLGTWRERPYTVTLEWVGGANPPWAEHGDEHLSCVLNIPEGAYTSWYVYPGDRWPQCSCCGEPPPCRAELEDNQVTASLDRVARLEAIPPGACWACAEPITGRQQSVTYPGENLDLPAGQQVHFHTRRQCRAAACAYEKRWISVDPRRERVLTWPRCDGILIVHADGSSECVPGPAPLGGDHREPQPDCRGHLTHDHAVIRACYVGDDYLRPDEWKQSGCPRGCSRADHHGIATTRRPERRQGTETRWRS